MSTNSTNPLAEQLTATGKKRKTTGDPYFCKNGHPKSERVETNGRVRCRACARLHQEAARQREKIKKVSDPIRFNEGRQSLLEINPATFSEELKQSIWERVSKQDDGHWKWTGQTSNAWKYGIFTMELSGRRRQFQAHRIIMHLVDPEYAGDRLVKQEDVCDDVACVNPDHWRTDAVARVMTPEETPEEVKQNTDPIRPCWGCLRPTREKHVPPSEAPGTVVRKGHYCDRCRAKGTRIELATAAKVTGREEERFNNTVAGLQHYMERRKQRLSKPNHLIHKLDLPKCEREA